MPLCSYVWYWSSSYSLHNLISFCLLQRDVGLWLFPSLVHCKPIVNINVLCTVGLINKTDNSLLHTSIWPQTDNYGVLFSCYCHCLIEGILQKHSEKDQMSCYVAKESKAEGSHGHLSGSELLFDPWYIPLRSLQIGNILPIQSLKSSCALGKMRYLAVNGPLRKIKSKFWSTMKLKTSEN